MIFQITLTAVLVLLLTAVPGYLLIKKKMISEDCLSGCSKILLYVSQPCLAVYTFRSTSFSVEKLANIGILALLTAFLMLLMLGCAFVILRKRYEKPIYRIITIGTTFANCAFFGIPIIEAILPESAADLILYTTVFAVVMNIVGWTIGAAIIAQDARYMSAKKIFLNPATIGLAVALVIFIFGIPLQKDLESMITTTARMATPLSMLIMGMRLGTIKLPSLFTDYRVYLTVLVKQTVMPLLAFALVFFLPIPKDIAMTFFIVSACPAASVVLNFAEIIGEGQREAANIVLLGTILSVATLPVVMLLLPLLG